MFVLGTRPEVIKLAPVILRFKQSPRFLVHVCSTGQHREMLTQALDTFDLAPDSELGVMTGNQALADLSSRTIAAIDTVYRTEKPALVFVQGDTTTAMTAALGSYYHRIPVAHVEAGLRTDNKLSPFPEEMNRRLIASIADLHFAPTDRARDNLMREGVGDGDIHVTGNTAIDALLLVIEKQRDRQLRLKTLAGATIDDDDLASKRLIVVTAHRRENHDAGLASICAAIVQLASFPDAIVVFPVHLNPNVRAIVVPMLQMCSNVHLTDPLDYVTFCRLMARSYLILTDSGGIQEEAPSLNRPILVLRDTTERQEGITAGNALLVGTAAEDIVRETKRLWNDPALYMKMTQLRNPYGDGLAAARIFDIVANRLGPIGILPLSPALQNDRRHSAGLTAQ